MRWLKINWEDLKMKIEKLNSSLKEWERKVKLCKEKTEISKVGLISMKSNLKPLDLSWKKRKEKVLVLKNMQGENIKSMKEIWRMNKEETKR